MMTSVDRVAHALNLTPQRVQQLVKEGLPRGARGEYELGACMAWYIRYLQAAIERRSSGGAPATSLAAARTSQARARTERMHAQNVQARGEVILLEVLQAKLREAWAATGRVLRPSSKRVNTDQATRTAIGAEVAAVLESLAQALEALGGEKLPRLRRNGSG
jgi:phage terminase Nu1 subunit (DNA packaging protein)